MKGKRAALYANYGEQELVMDADTLQIISSSAPARVVGMLNEWAQQHHAELLAALEQLKSGRAPANIAPLQ